MAGKRTLNPLLQRINKVVRLDIASSCSKIITNNRIGAFSSLNKTSFRSKCVASKKILSLINQRQMNGYHFGRAFLSTSTKYRKRINSDLDEEEENEHHLEGFEESPAVLVANTVKEDRSTKMEKSDKVNAASVLIDVGRAQSLHKDLSKSSTKEEQKNIQQASDDFNESPSVKRKERLTSPPTANDSKISESSTPSRLETNLNLVNSSSTQSSSPRQSKNVSISNGAINNSRSMLSVPSRSSKRCFYVPVFNPLPAMKDKTLAILDYKLWSIKDCNEFDEKVSQTELKLPPSTFVTTEARGVELYSLDDVLDSIPYSPIHELSANEILGVNSHLDNIKGDKRHTIKLKSRRK